MGCLSSKTAPPASQPASALGQAASLSPMPTAEANAVAEAEAIVVADKPDAEAAEHRLTPDELAAATARYSTPAELRALLTHDAALGGVAVRLLSARWVLEYFQANADARLEHRQHLEAAHGDAPFVTGEALERMLAEVEEREYEDWHGRTRTGCLYVSKAADGEYRAVTVRGNPVAMAFPSIVAISHMWLDPEHPDPHARNLRERWLPAIEWYYSERVRQLTRGGQSNPKDADGRELSDAAVLSAADFGLFIDLSAMVQKDPATGERTAIEVGLFKHALGSLDVIYAHKALVRPAPPRLAPHVPCACAAHAPRARRCRRACCRPPRRAAWSWTAGTRTAGGRASSAPRGS